MRYPQSQWDEVVAAWAQAVQRTRPAALNGLTKDLRHYVAFERASAAYADVITAARSLGTSYDAERLRFAAARVRGALEAATDALRLTRVPGEDEIERALRRWQLARVARHGGTLPGMAFEWKPDERVPERSDFPRTAVTSALAREGSVPAGRVFTGTAHLNMAAATAALGLRARGQGGQSGQGGQGSQGGRGGRQTPVTPSAPPSPPAPAPQ
ncbi:hypothetical protein [Streptomyces sp. NPDC001530]|uniref:hypothetical protein n=1 Tax=Streptomyces sp. NPDC001530 TaxID=3364582 RepID=UPI0036B7AAB3